MHQGSDSNRRCKKTSLCLLPVLFLSALPGASLGVMTGLSTEELAGAADLVVLGDVGSVGAGWNADRTTIITTANVVVAEAIKGRAAGRTVEVEYPGGEVGDIGLRVSDEPSMEEGERILVFLKRAGGLNEGNRYKLVGKGQGKYSIGPDGVARKKGFSLAGDTKRVDVEIPLGILIEKIKRAE